MEEETALEFYERRVDEIMKTYLKNIKECEQRRDKGVPLDKKNDDIRDVF